MKIIVENWKIKDLFDKREKINPKPQYQRTSVWQQPKKKLLIDSIFRGYDIPKFYFRETPQDLIYDYEVTDGQQRMRSILEFMKDEYKLDESVIDGFNTKGLNFSDIKKIDIKKKFFLDYNINVAIIKEASQEEIRALFSRLQMGEKLNPVELRHAMASNIGNAVVSIVENHDFFKSDCKIPDGRFKHQDYLDNALTLCNYDCSKSIKASDIRFFYNDLANSTLVLMQPLLLKANSVLNYMKSINDIKKGIFKNKWAFVDTFYLLFKNYELIQSIKSKEFAKNFLLFEQRRRQYNSNPEVLIEEKTSLIYDKDLYDYIIAFKTSGADKNNIKIRYRVFYNKFYNNLNFEI